MAELQRRRLGRTEMSVTSLSLGCASMGYARRTDQEVIAAIRRAIELGINFVDTSPYYDESEHRVGLALAGGWRERVYLETKVGTHPDHYQDFSGPAIRWSVENSLRLLGTDYLDSVLIHDPEDIEDPLGPGRALDELLRMKDQGLVRHIGLGVRSHAFHKRAIESGQIEIILAYLDYTLLSQSVAATTLPLAVQWDVGVIVGSVLAMGSLGGAEPQADPQAHAMWSWCREHGVDIRHLALQFAMALPYTNATIMPGPSTAAHVDDVYCMATTPVEPDIWRSFKTEFGVGVEN